MNEQMVIEKQLLSFVCKGNRSGRAILFLHGWRSQKEVWQGTFDALLKEHPEFCIVTLDLPGFGSSSLPQGDWKVGDYAELVAKFIKKMELKDLVLVGHSFGGRVAVKLASVRTDLIKKLVLVDAAGFVMQKAKKDALKLAAKIVKPLFKPKFMQGLRKKIYKSLGAEDYVETPELRQVYLNAVNEDLTPSLKRILQPTLIVFGEADTDTPVEYGKQMNGLIQNSKLQIIKNAGHFSFLDKPNEFVNLLNDFIN